MSMTVSWRAAVALAAALALSTSVAAAQTTSTAASASPRGQSRDARARALFERGVQLADRLEWAEAALAFEQSFALAPRPATLMNLGLAHRALGRYMDAIAELERFVAQVDIEPALAERVRGILRDMRQLIATITVSPSPASASIRFDDVARSPGVPFDADPGRHVLSVFAPGFLRHSENVEIRRGERRLFVTRLDPARPMSPWPWVVGVGVAVVAAVVTTAVVIGTTAERPAQCGTFNLCIPVP